jgi:hypothetical protein
VTERTDSYPMSPLSSDREQYAGPVGVKSGIEAHDFKFRNCLPWMLWDSADSRIRMRSSLNEEPSLGMVFFVSVPSGYCVLGEGLPT